jgi:capsular polysaccharide transport system permease protein
VVQAQRRIDVIRQRIAEERRSFAAEVPQSADPSDRDGRSEDYPSLLAEYEGLMVDREFAEETYRAALAGFDLARAKAERQSRYLATYIEPTRAQQSEFPQRLSIFGLVAGFLVLLWGVLALIYYSVRDRA